MKKEGEEVVVAAGEREEEKEVMLISLFPSLFTGSIFPQLLLPVTSHLHA